MPDIAANPDPAPLLQVKTRGVGIDVLSLKPGRMTVGRGAENDVRLNHPSVSNKHCEIEVGSEGAIVRDLGSTNGTFIDGERIQNGALRPGQKLLLGEVELGWCDGVAGSEQAQAPLAAEARPRCASHPQVRAAWVCTECHRPFCAACVKPVALGPRKSVILCQVCHGLCERVEKLSRRGAPMSFAGGLFRALTFPLGPAGLVVLLAAMVLNLAFAFAGHLFVFGGASALLGLGLGAVLLAFLRQVVLTSADGEDSFPGWPELDLESLRETIVLWLAVSLVCFGPWTLCNIAVRLEVDAARWVCPVLLGLGAVYFPMALLAVAIQDDAGAMNPVLVCGSILRTARRYLALCLFLAALAGAVYGVEAASAAARLPHLGAAVTGFLSFYAALVVARAIGWFYYCTKDDLGW
ncbi:MAG: FHA domain-containing protein [Verrucomicrobiia bacterium]